MTAHVHHWILPPPNGPTSLGVCACGESREFKNSTDDHVWKEMLKRGRQYVRPENRQAREWGER